MIGPLIVDIQGLELSEEDCELLINPLIGGIILFKRNYVNPEQLKALTHAIKALPRENPLLISVDHEGGLVQRFRDHFTLIPSMVLLGRLYQTDPEKAEQTAFLIGWLLAAELRQCGVDYSYAPVLDLNYGCSTVIGERAFDSDPQIVLTLSKALIKGMHEVGMAATGKHFPGHGAVSADSHFTLPVDQRNIDSLLSADLVPYIKLIEEKYLDSIMTAHIVYSQIDQNPVCFSSFWIQSVLRDKLAFEGVIVSDDLTMEGAAVVGDYGKRARLALEAGCDMLLVCNNREAVLQAIAEIKQNYVFDSQSARPLLASAVELRKRSSERCQRLYPQPLPDNFHEHQNWTLAKELIQQLAPLAVATT